MDTLRGLPEHIEAEFGDAIVARDESLGVLATSPALGPPDLCWLQKCPKKTLLGGGGEAQGYYHFALGRDVSSSAAVAAYFALLTSKVEPRSMLQGLWLAPEFEIQRGFYCCYDAISGTDLRCELCVPGGVVAGCVDAGGALRDATPQLWLQAQVCAFVRATLYGPEMRLNGGSVIAYDPVPSAAAEAALLAAVTALYRGGQLPGALADLHEDQGCGVAPEQMDLVLAALWQHFRRRQRWAAARDFFRQLAPIYSPAALLLAAAEGAQALGGLGGGAPLLSELLTRPPISPPGGLQPLHAQPVLVPATLVGLGHELLAQGETEAAASLARRALAACPRCRPAWLLLAQCFIADGQYAAALVALNVVPTPPLPAAEVELLHVVPPPPPRATTHPQTRLYDGELEGVRWMALEEASLDGSRLLAYLPGSILVNREPLGAGFYPDVCPDRITRSVLASVYVLLQDIVAHTSWDSFLEIRSRVFLMQHEVAVSPRTAPSSARPTRPDGDAGARPGDSPPRPSQEGQPRPQLQAHLQQQALLQQQAVAAALQASQQAALQRKLEQLGLERAQQQQAEASSSSTPSPAFSSPAAPAGTPPPAAPAAGGALMNGGGTAAAAAAAAAASGSASSPARAGATGGSSAGGAGALASTTAAASPSSSHAQHGLRPGSRGGSGTTPPPSRGRRSSGGGAKGGGSPKSYYASRLEHLARQPGAQAGSSGGGSAASPVKAGAAQQPAQAPAAPQQQPLPSPLLQHSPAAVAGSPSGSSSAPGGLPRHAPLQPGEGQRSMAGRVLLLGRTRAARLSAGATPGSTPPHSAPGGVFGTPHGVGCGVPRSLAPNEVEDLSKYATASKVAPLRKPAVMRSGSITPALWEAVFGSASRASTPQRPPTPAGDAAGGDCAGAAGAAGAPAAPVTRWSDPETGADDEGLSAAAAGLPRIRTRPLGEAVEERQHVDAATWQQQQQQQQQQQLHPGSACSSVQHQHQQHWVHGCSCQLGSTPPPGGQLCPLCGGAGGSRSSSDGSSSGRSSQAQRGASWLTGCFTCRSQQQLRGGRQAQPRQAGPLGEGLDRTVSLLRRTVSIASSVATPASTLARAGRSGSGALGAALARRASLASESASRSLEADREGLMRGLIHDDASAQAGWGGASGAGGGDAPLSPGAGGRRLCVRWLDELIVALWHDLQAYMEWKVWDQNLREARGCTAAELVLGLAPGGSSAAGGGPGSPAGAADGTPGSARGVADGGGLEPPVLTCSDWMRRGALAERLGHVADARAAYRAAVKLHMNLTSYTALLRLEAAAGSVADGALCAQQVLVWHQQRAGQCDAGGGGASVADAAPAAAPAAAAGSAAAPAAAGGAGVVTMGVPPECVAWALGALADAAGVDEVRAALGGCTPAQRSLDDWERWQGVKVAGAAR